MGQKPLKYVALIPARGGSKGIPGKNIKLLAGRPLIYWACKAAEEARSIKAVYVSTNDSKIADVARSFGLSKLHVIDRAPETATDSASTESCMLDFAKRVKFANVILLQATSPLITSNDLDRAVEVFEKRRCDSVISIVRQKRFIWKQGAKGLIEPANYNPRKRPRRQDHEGFYVENGAIYLTSLKVLLEHGCRVGNRVAYVEMAPDTYFEIDEPDDWRVVEMLLERRLATQSDGWNEKLKKIRFVAADVDGVLTDGGMYYGDDGTESKKFQTRDGKGFELLRQAGFLTGIITGETISIITRRGQKLKLDEVHQGALDKVKVMTEILHRRAIRWDEVAYIGDDVGDVELLKRVGVSCAPRDAMPCAMRCCNLPLKARGGEGALRELAEMILAARNK
ncbi:MAG: HAD hydrolase family protein [bacterium]